MNMNPEPTIFRIQPRSKPIHSSPFLQFAGDTIIELAERALGIDVFNRAYNSIIKSSDIDEFIQSAKRQFGVGFNISPGDRNRIPKSGPLLVTANHPFGILDPLGMIELIRQRRSDLKIITNRLMATIPEIAPLCIFVDPKSNGKAAKTNMKAMLEAVHWLKDGGVIGVFPAGEVASFDLRQARIVEREWTIHIARLIRHSKSAALPIYFHGTNSLIFHLSGLIHPMLRTALLPRESLIRQGTSISAVVGNPISYKRLSVLADDREMVEFIKRRTMILSHRFSEKKKRNPVHSSHIQIPALLGTTSSLLHDEIEALPEKQRLIQLGDFKVFYATAEQIPRVLKEIGRLREITFREVGEGTGKPEDIDSFDLYYIHLFVWQSAKAEIVGAYRLGRTDDILKTIGKKGLYTSTLFDFQPALLGKLNPALELGRSWVRKEYQRSSIALALLWRGICAYVAMYPQYNRLFGPVSLSNDYNKISHQLIVNFIEQNNYHHDFSHQVRSLQPFRLRLPSDVLKQMRLESLEDLSEVISDLETDGKGVPVLLKEYMKLGGRILGFNIDKEFGNVVDGLIMVDLLKTDPKLLERYMGKDGMAKFYSHHGKEIK
jgi:putative hemolysin